MTPAAKSLLWSLAGLALDVSTLTAFVWLTVLALKGRDWASFFIWGWCAALAFDWAMKWLRAKANAAREDA